MSPQFAKPKNSPWETLLTKLAVLISILMIVGGAIGMILVQEDLKKSQDLRQQASVAQGQVEVTTSAPGFTIGQAGYVEFSINTHGVQTDGVQLTFNLVTSTLNEAPVFALKSGVPLQIAYSEIETTADGYLISIIAVPSTIGQSYSTSSSTDFARLSLTPVRAGQITLNFDIENSISTVHASNPPRDELTHIATANFVVGSVETSPSPSPSASPNASPSPSPSASPSVSPSPTPGIGGDDLQSCNESCSVNADCQNNMRCFTGKCRLVTNVSSTTCSAPPDNGLDFACNEYCADTRECADGLVCQNNKCRNPENLESTRCTQLTVVQKNSLTQSCNESCDANADCDANLRCYQGACRLATNPGSFSCKPSTTKTVSTSIYGETKGGNTGEATRSAKSTGKVDTTTTTKVVTPTPAPEEKTALDSVKNYFLANPQFPIVAMGVGIGLILVLVLLSILKSAGRRRPPTPPTSGGMTVGNATPPRVYEENLQNKINALKEPATPSTPPTVMTPPPTAVPKSESFLPPSTLRSMSSIPASQPAPAMPAPAAPEVSASAPASASTDVFVAPTTPPTPQSMLERLKSRNVTPPSV